MFWLGTAVNGHYSLMLIVISPGVWLSGHDGTITVFKDNAVVITKLHSTAARSFVLPDPGNSHQTDLSD